MKYSNEIFQDLFQTKAHIGTTTWEKMMSPFLIGSRNDIFIFNLELTLVCLKQVLKVLENIRKKNGHILFVNTSSKYSELVKNTAGKLNQSYVNDRWVGGTLTNWKQVSESIFLFKKFSFQFETFLKIYNIQIPVYQKAKKRYEGLNIARRAGFADSEQIGRGEQALTEQPQRSCRLSKSEAARSPRIDSLVDSISNVSIWPKANTNQQNTIPQYRSNSSPAYLPDIIILINPDQNEILLQEAKTYQIPVIAFADSNTKNKNINYIIPGNTKSISFMYFCLNLFTIILQKNK